jgi:hypothetical protein
LGRRCPINATIETDKTNHVMRNIALKTISYAFGAAVVAQFTVLLAGMCVFGFHFAQWAEWQGRIVGAVSTLAGIASAPIGLRLALHKERQPAK